MTNSKERQRAAYNKFSLQYESAVSHVHKVLKPYSIDVWKNKCMGKDILEIGCGNAYVLRQLLLSNIGFKSYHGIDISDEMIKNNKELYQNVNNILFTVDDAETLDQLSNKQYDIALSYGCLHHLEYPDRAIKSVCKHLKDKGWFFALELNRNHPTDSFVGFYSYIIGLDGENVKSVLNKVVGRLSKRRVESSGLDTYAEHHPGHPGKRTPDEYRQMLRNAGFVNLNVNCLYLNLFHYSFYTASTMLFRLMVMLSKPLLRTRRLRDVGSILLIEARK
jgi:SAM-dependent methyltransferase